MSYEWKEKSYMKACLFKVVFQWLAKRTFGNNIIFGH